MSVFTVTALVVGVTVLTSSTKHADAALGSYKTAVNAAADNGNQAVATNQSVSPSNTNKNASTPASANPSKTDSVTKPTVKPVVASAATSSTGNSTTQQNSSNTAFNSAVSDSSALKPSIPDHGGYPDKWANPALDSVTDDFGYLNREGTSYVAWKAHNTFPDILISRLSNLGDAKDWPYTASFPSGSTPEVNSAFSVVNSNHGEVYWVMSVGVNSFTASAYNYDNAGNYRTYTFPNNKPGAFIYFDK